MASGRKMHPHTQKVASMRALGQADAFLSVLPSASSLSMVHRPKILHCARPFILPPNSLSPPPFTATPKAREFLASRVHITERPLESVLNVLFYSLWHPLHLTRGFMVFSELIFVLSSIVDVSTDSPSSSVLVTKKLTNRLNIYPWHN